MTVSAILRFSRIALIALAVTFGLIGTSGCGGGFGEFKPTITSQGAGTQTVTAGQTATFTLTATGTRPFTYQWYANGVAIQGANSSSYTTPPTTGRDNGTVYSASVTNASGTVTVQYLLTVNTPPTITIQPAGQAVVAGQPATFTVVATGTAPINYQWNLGGVAISGATSSSYAVPPTNVVNSGSVYTVTLTNLVGSVTSAGATLLVSPDPVVLTFTPITAQTYGNASFEVSATSASIGAVTYSVTSGPAMVSGNTVTLTGVGTVVLGASQVANGNYTAATATTSFTVSLGSQTITFANPGAQNYGTPLTLSATASSGLAVSYSVTSGQATLSGSTLTFTDEGSVTVQVTQAGNTNYAAATPVLQTFTVNAESQTITFANPGAQNYGTPLTLRATASSGLAVSYSVTSGQATLSGSTLTFTGEGSVTVQVTQAGNTNYAAATPVLQTFTVKPSLPVITTQPVSKNVCAGSSPSFTVGAINATSYQWTPLGVDSIGTSSSTITFSNVTASSNGNYTCAVTNSAGSVDSYTATLSVITTPTPLTITGNPTSVSVYATQTATFAVSASGTGTLHYKWYTGTPDTPTVINDATSSAYTTGALTTSDSGTSYFATITDTNCTNTIRTSTAATLTVTDTDTAVPPTIVIQPIGQTATVDGTAMFSVTASGPGTLTYQWYRVPYETAAYIASIGPTAGVVVASATSSTYTVTASKTAQSNDGDNYYVMVKNAYGSAQSIKAPLAVGNGILLQVTGQPQTVYVASGSLASYSVTSTCTGCIAAYQWYWGAPGATSFTALTNGEVTSGSLTSDSLNGATVSGATTSSITLESVPSSASGSILYVVVTSTSDGATQTSGTSPITSSNAGLFVGSLGTIDNMCSTSWVLNGGNSQGYSYVPYQNTTPTICSIELTNKAGSFDYAAIYWPTLISTAKFTVNFTVTMLADSFIGDGFAMILADPSQGATTASVGNSGEGLGARGIPGFVLGFDTFQNSGDGDDCSRDNTNGACDPMTVPYMAVGQGATNLWENPWTYVNGNLDTAHSTNYSVATFANATHSYVVTVVSGIMTVTMDGNELFTGPVTLPPVAYLGFTASTGGAVESVTISNLSATVSEP